MTGSGPSAGGTDHGLILLKCYGCKTPTLFRLEIRHEEDQPDFVASSYCTQCEKEDYLRKVMVRSLEPALVENQRIDSGGTGDTCHEANGGDPGV